MDAYEKDDVERMLKAVAEEVEREEGGPHRPKRYYRSRHRPSSAFGAAGLCVCGQVWGAGHPTVAAQDEE